MYNGRPYTPPLEAYPNGWENMKGPPGQMAELAPVKSCIIWFIWCLMVLLCLYRYFLMITRTGRWKEFHFKCWCMSDLVMASCDLNWNWRRLRRKKYGKWWCCRHRQNRGHVKLLHQLTSWDVWNRTEKPTVAEYPNLANILCLWFRLTV